MNIVSIIAEYNPFHLGHAYQIDTARKSAGAGSAVLAVMSGSFTQRGEPALTDKWSRTCMALNGGIDLVIELPFPYACASAERFASGAVQLLHKTGLDSTLFFGSESGDLEALKTVAGWLKPESHTFRRQLKSYLNEGHSFPRARQLALSDITGQDQRVDLLEQPNNILAIEYLKAIQSIDRCRLTPKTIQRIGQSHHSDQLPDSRMPASANAIRRTVLEQVGKGNTTGLYVMLDSLQDAMPTAALAELMTRIQSGPGPLSLEHLSLPILTILRSRSPSELSSVSSMAEGLPERLCQSAERLESSSDQRIARLIDQARTRRFPQTRIQRALIAMLAGLTDNDLALFDASGGPAYIRVLGFTRKGRYLLKMMRKKAECPIITRASDFLEYGGQLPLKRMAALDLTASDIWQIAAGQACGVDFDRSVIMI